MSSHSKSLKSKVKSQKSKVRPSTFDLRLSTSVGFTLIEVLVAISILAVGLVLVVQAMGRTQLALRLSENVIRASYIAEEEMVKKELKVRELGRVVFGGEKGKREFPGRVMEWESSMRPFQHSSMKEESRLNKLTVKVDWKESARQNNLEIQTLVLNRRKIEPPA